MVKLDPAEPVHFPNAQQNGPCCGKVSVFALKVQVTQDVRALTCVDCALAMLHAQAEANGALVARLGVLLDAKRASLPLTESSS